MIVPGLQELRRVDGSIGAIMALPETRYVGTRGPGGIWVDGEQMPSDAPSTVTSMNVQDVIHAENQAEAAKANAKCVRKQARRQRREQKQRELSIAVATLTLIEVAGNPQFDPADRVEASKLLLHRSGVV